MEREPIRVLYASATDCVGGAETSLLTLWEALDRTRVSPILVCPPRTSTPSLAVEAERLQVQVIELPLRRFRYSLKPWHLASTWRACRGARRQVASVATQLQVDLIHANSPMAALQVEGAPVVCHLRDLRLSHLAGKALAGRIAVVVTPSQAVACLARSRIGPCVRVIPNGVNVDRFCAGAGEEIGDHPIVLMVGHLIPWKRHDLFLEVMAEVRSKQPHIRGVIAGADLTSEHNQYEKDLLAFAADLGLAYAVEWRHHVPYDQLQRLMASATVLLHPAAREPFGRSVLEAMACATPVVAVDAAGPRELLAHGGGVLVSPGDVPAMTRAVETYLRQPARVREDGSLGRCAALDRYTATHHARSMEKLYDDIVPGRSSY